jgi:hypothetical protein
LLAIQATSIATGKFTLTKTAVFDTSLWNTSSSYGSESVSLWSGIHRENLTQPAWSGDTFVIEPFGMSDYKAFSNYTYSATTRGIYPGLDCAQAKFVRGPIYFNDTVGFRHANVSYSSGSCTLDKTLDLADPTQRNQRQNKWAAENYMGTIQAVDCSGTESFLVTVTQADRSLTITNYR